MKLILAAALLFLAACDNAPQHLPMTGVTVERQAGKTLRLGVEVADDTAERAQGLMNRPLLPEDRGMLFIFDKTEMQSFWMHNTQIPLDMLFLDENGKVLHIHERAVPYSETAIPSRFPAKMVLEVNAGWARKWDVNVGDTITVDKTWSGN